MNLDYELHQNVFYFVHKGTLSFFDGIVWRTAIESGSSDYSKHCAKNKWIFHGIASCIYCVRIAFTYAWQNMDMSYIACKQIFCNKYVAYQKGGAIMKINVAVISVYL